MTAQQILTTEDEPGSATHRSLSTSIDTTRDAVHEVLDAAEAFTRHKAIARMSSHLAAMSRTVYPHAAGQFGPAAQLREVCLRRGREVEWTMRGLECHMAGEMYAAGRPHTAVSSALGQRLDSYWPAERELVGWVEDQLSPGDRDKLAHAYWRALAHAPTRPHPRSPRSGPLRHAAFWWHGRWDRLLDGVDSRAGVGRDFALVIAQPCCAQPAPATAEDGPGDDGELG